MLGEVNVGWESVALIFAVVGLVGAIGKIVKDSRKHGKAGCPHPETIHSIVTARTGDLKRSVGRLAGLAQGNAKAIAVVETKVDTLEERTGEIHKDVRELLRLRRNGGG